MIMICNAAVTALAGLAAMGYTLPDWFKHLLGIILIVFLISLVFYIPKIIKMICGIFKEDCEAYEPKNKE